MHKSAPILLRIEIANPGVELKQIVAATYDESEGEVSSTRHAHQPLDEAHSTPNSENGHENQRQSADHYVQSVFGKSYPIAHAWLEAPKEDEEAPNPDVPANATPKCDR